MRVVSSILRLLLTQNQLKRLFFNFVLDLILLALAFMTFHELVLIKECVLKLVVKLNNQTPSVQKYEYIMSCNLVKVTNIKIQFDYLIFAFLVITFISQNI